MIPLNQSLGSYITELKVKIKAIKDEKKRRLADEKKRRLAMGTLEQVRKLTLEEADRWEDLGRAYQQQGNTEASKDCFGKASNLRTMR